MIISLALSFIAIASGAVLTYIYDEDAPLASRLCSGACIGFGAMGLVGFVLAFWIREIIDDAGRAAFAESFDHLRANAAGASGHENHFAGEIEIRHF